MTLIFWIGSVFYDWYVFCRISVESSKNAKLLLEISHLKTDVAEKTNQITALKMHVQELETHGEEKENVKSKLTEEINFLKQKYYSLIFM